MAVVIGVVVGVVFGFVFGWLVRDAATRPLISDDDEFGLGVPADWHRRQTRERQR